MLKYASGEKPRVGDKVADGLGTSWKGTVIRIHGQDHEPPFKLNNGESMQIITEALIIKYEEMSNPIVEEEPEDELILIARHA